MTHPHPGPLPGGEGERQKNAMAVPLEQSGGGDSGGRKPAWLKMKMPGGEEYAKLLGLVHEHRLHTVCQSAKCPNLGECWRAGTATLMILGNVCTRACRFCNVVTGRPGAIDRDEPRRVGDAVRLMNLKHVVVTSVNRDELPDGGAGAWAETIRQIRRQSPATRVEVLIPDFCGDVEALRTVLETRPDVLGHNLETVPRLYRTVRPQARFQRSLEVLRRAKEGGVVTKTGLMLGVGEEAAEIEAVMDELVGISCDILTLGQYLRPTPKHLPVQRWVHPDEFAAWKKRGEDKGLKHVEAGPMVRSSYHAERQAGRL